MILAMRCEGAPSSKYSSLVGGVRQCAEGTQAKSPISNDTLKPDGALITSANKETKRKHHTIF